MKKKKRVIKDFRGEYSFLSNFYHAPFKLSFMYREKIPTVEHFFQAHKSVPNGELYDEILAADTPSEAKKLGREARLRKDWEKVKYSIMLQAVRFKFYQNPSLGRKLIDTGDAILIEGNLWHDNVWGNCWCDKCEDIKGDNLLGKILMTVREELKQI